MDSPQSGNSLGTALGAGNKQSSSDQEDMQDYYIGDDTAIIIKWSVFSGLLLLVLLWAVIGHLHARRRLRKGLPLLLYHKYLISSSKVPSSLPPNAFTLHRLNDPENYHPPPPAYTAAHTPPPIYEPPALDFKMYSPRILEDSSDQQEQQAVQPKKSLMPQKWRLFRSR